MVASNFLQFLHFFTIAFIAFLEETHLCFLQVAVYHNGGSQNFCLEKSFVNFIGPDFSLFCQAQGNQWCCRRFGLPLMEGMHRIVLGGLTSSGLSPCQYLHSIWIFSLLSWNSFLVTLSPSQVLFFCKEIFVRKSKQKVCIGPSVQP